MRYLQAQVRRLGVCIAFSSEPLVKDQLKMTKGAQKRVSPTLLWKKAADIDDI